MLQKIKIRFIKHKIFFAITTVLHYTTIDNKKTQKNSGQLEHPA